MFAMMFISIASNTNTVITIIIIVGVPVVVVVTVIFGVRFGFPLVIATAIPLQTLSVHYPAADRTPGQTDAGCTATLCGTEHTIPHSFGRTVLLGFSAGAGVSGVRNTLHHTLVS